jgi:hypothetical protein
MEARNASLATESITEGDHCPHATRVLPVRQCSGAETGGHDDSAPRAAPALGSKTLPRWQRLARAFGRARFGRARFRRASSAARSSQAPHPPGSATSNPSSTAHVSWT